MKTYIDKRGWKYSVRPGLGGDTFNGFYQKPGKTGWKSMKQMKWYKSPDEAQRELDKIAKAKGWSCEHLSDLLSLSEAW